MRLKLDLPLCAFVLFLASSVCSGQDNSQFRGAASGGSSTLPPAASTPGGTQLAGTADSNSSLSESHQSQHSSAASFQARSSSASSSDAAPGDTSPSASPQSWWQHAWAAFMWPVTRHEEADVNFQHQLRNSSAGGTVVNASAYIPILSSRLFVDRTLSLNMSLQTSTAVASQEEDAGSTVSAHKHVESLRAAASVAAAARRKSDVFRQWERRGRRWLLPVLVFGPNNQVTGLKEALVISKLLDRVMILPDIYEHGKELEADKKGVQQRAFPFDEVFDVKEISKFTKVVLQRHAMQTGWDGTLKSLLFWERYELPYLDRVKESADIRTTADAERIHMSGTHMCNTNYAYNLKRKLKNSPVLGVFVYNKMIKNARHHSLHLESTQSKEDRKCYDIYRDATEHLHKAPYIQEIAREFIQSHLGGTAFVAVHVRPYPDTCMTRWKNGELSWKEKVKACHNPRLDKVIGKQSAGALQMAKVNNTLVFAASHPSARKVVEQQLRGQGLTPVYLSPQYVLDALVQRGKAVNGSHLSTTVLMFVEQEIAVQSKIFVGTLESSITGMIRQERAARGTPSAWNLVFHN